MDHVKREYTLYNTISFDSTSQGIRVVFETDLLISFDSLLSLCSFSFSTIIEFLNGSSKADSTEVCSETVSVIVTTHRDQNCGDETLPEYQVQY